MRVFVDAVRMVLTLGVELSDCLGSWGPRGARVHLCPPWVTAWQATKLWGEVVRMDEAHPCGARYYLVLVGDNMGALVRLL